jgi:hypothetical protein
MSKIEFGAEIVEPLQPGAAMVRREPRFVIGRGRSGGWIVHDRLGLVGGIFISEAAARHFAFEESGGRKDEILVVQEALSLDLDTRKAA